MRHPAIGPIGLAGLVLTSLLLSTCSSSTSPAVSDDDLVRVEGTSLDQVYQQPEFEISAFQRLSVEKCSVQFRDNWLRDQNRYRAPHRRVTADDMNQIEEYLATSCLQIFSTKLEEIEFGDDETPGGEKILTIRPAIVDLDITAPDVQASGRETNFTTSPARMSLRVELIDSATGSIQGRMIDHRRADDTMNARQTSVVGNRAETERILNFWAALVREQLEKSAD